MRERANIKESSGFYTISPYELHPSIITQNNLDNKTHPMAVNFKIHTCKIKLQDLINYVFTVTTTQECTHL